jgi:hypothetical protein
MSARTILNPATNTALEGLGSGVLVIDNPTYPGNSISFTTGDNIADITFNNSTTQWPSTNSSINFDDFNLNIICEQGTGSSITLSSSIVNISSNLSFGTGAGFKIVQGSFPCPALTPSNPTLTDTIFLSNTFVGTPSIFMSYQNINASSGGYSGLFTCTAGFVGTGSFRAMLQGTVGVDAGVGTINYIAIGN